MRRHPSPERDAPPAPLPPPSRTFLTVTQLAQQQPGLSVGGIRWDLFNRATNGLAESGAVIQRGRKLLIDAELYLKWLAGPDHAASWQQRRGAAR